MQREDDLPFFELLERINNDVSPLLAYWFAQ